MIIQTFPQGKSYKRGIPLTPLYLDGHAVIITGYDEDHGTVYYWDPETGESGIGAVGDYIQGWSVNGVKE